MENTVNIDIATTVKVILGFLGLAAVITLVMAYKSIQAGHKLLFYQKRQTLVYHGWRLVLMAGVFLLVGFLIFQFGEPVAYRYFPPSPTTTLTPTITITPTITLTPSQTFTPTITLTLAQTYTPSLPEQLQATIQTPVGVDTSAIFSPLSFASQTQDGVVVDSETEFVPPVTTLYGGFSYDRMAIGVQWSAIWRYGEEIICSETKSWTYAPGGYGYTDCTRPKEEWKAGIYEVQIFVGSSWKVSGTFLITGPDGLPADEPVTTAIPEVPTLLPTLTPPPPGG